MEKDSRSKVGALSLVCLPGRTAAQATRLSKNSRCSLDSKWNKRDVDGYLRTQVLRTIMPKRTVNRKLIAGLAACAV